MPYRPHNRSDKAKAMTGALAVTAVLGAGVITGLNVHSVGEAVERLSTFDINLPKPPPPPPPKPRPTPERKQESAPAAPKAAPVVAPKPRVQLPAQQPVQAAPKAGTGASSSAGAGGAGSGSGAGGSGTGLGSGGGGGGNTPAHLIRNLTRGDYRALTAGRIAAGSAGLALRIDTSGRIDSCRVERSSGDPQIDAGLCPLVQSRLLFDPARDGEGRPIAFFTHYMAVWRR